MKIGQFLSIVSASLTLALLLYFYIERKDNVKELAETLSDTDYKYYLIACFLPLTPAIIDGLLDLLINKSFPTTICAVVPNILILFLLSIPPIIPLSVGLLLVFIQINASICHIIYLANSYFDLDEPMLSYGFHALIISVFLNCISHITSGLTFTILLSFSAIFLLGGLIFIAKICFKWSNDISYNGSIPFRCISICMISLVVLTLGCATLRIISLISDEKGFTYLTGLTILPTICTLPVLMLDGRIARYNAAKNEVRNMCICQKICKIKC